MTRSQLVSLASRHAALYRHHGRAADRDLARAYRRQIMAMDRRASWLATWRRFAGQATRLEAPLYGVMAAVPAYQLHPTIGALAMLAMAVLVAVLDLRLERRLRSTCAASLALCEIDRWEDEAMAYRWLEDRADDLACKNY